MRAVTLACLAVSAITLSGCTTSQRAQSISTSERLCSIDSLRAQRDDQIRSARGLSDMAVGLVNESDLGLLGIDIYGERTLQSGETVVTEPPFGPGTEITRLIRTFETDLDASYRFASSSCQAYAMCMQGNRYDESRCSGTRESWVAAQTNFAETSADLAEIREAIATLHIENQRPYRRVYRSRGHHH